MLFLPRQALFQEGDCGLSEKRKDKKGRILRPGEGQRPNGTYFYRYHNAGDKKWSYAYAPTLEELREKEETIQRDLLDGIDYAGGEITVSELVDRYINLRRGLKQNSMRAYGTAIKRVHADPFGQRKIKTVKLSDGKSWFVSLHDEGLKQNTIGVIQSVVRPAFEMAVDDDYIRKNPFKFNLSDVIPNDAYIRPALTKKQQEQYLQFIRDYGNDNYYDDILILLGTGMRVSELYGLTKADVDFDRRRIRVEKQLCRTADKPYFIAPPKTASGNRDIPMTDTVYMALKRVTENRAPKMEMLIDGHSGFLFLDKDDKPKVAMHLENYMRWMQKKYVKLYGKTLPNVTPHVLRHTFCTNAQQAKLDVKSLQYIMGHSTASVTLDVYTHSDFDSAERAFKQIATAL